MSVEFIIPKKVVEKNVVNIVGSCQASISLSYWAYKGPSVTTTSDIYHTRIDTSTTLTTGCICIFLWMRYSAWRYANFTTCRYFEPKCRTSLAVVINFAKGCSSKNKWGRNNSGLDFGYCRLLCIEHIHNAAFTGDLILGFPFFIHSE